MFHSTATSPLSTSFSAVFSKPLGGRGGVEVLQVLGNHSAAESHPSSLISSILLLSALSAADTAESYILRKAGRQGS